MTAYECRISYWSSDVCSYDIVKPRIGMIGTGSIGGFYGVMLARAGFDVHFLLRSEFGAVAEGGLRVDSAVHGAPTLNPVQAYRSAADMPPCDWLLVGAKPTRNADLSSGERSVGKEGVSTCKYRWSRDK